MLEVITDKKILRTKCTLSDDPDKTLNILKENFNKERYFGLAAIQLGINDRVAVVYEKERDGFIDVVNWEILERDLSFEFEEACLSLPGKVYVVERYRQILFKDRYGDQYVMYYGNLPGEISTEEERDRYSIPDIKVIAIQQEIDHMNGILLEDIAKSVRDVVVTQQQVVSQRKIGRNEPCFCGSGKKYKKCCGGWR